MRVQSSKCKDQRLKLGTSQVLYLAIFVLVLTVVACSPKASQVKSTEQVKPAFIEKMEVGEADGITVLTIRTTAPLQGNYTVLKDAEPPKAVIEMPDVDPDRFAGPIEVNDGTIGTIVTSSLNGKGARVEVFLSQLVEHEIKVEGNSLEVYFAKTKQQVTEKPLISEEAAPLTPVATAAAEVLEKPAKPLRIVDVKFKKVGNFTTGEIITDGEPTAYNVFSLKAPNRVVVDIGNAREIPSKKEIRAESPYIKGARLGRYDEKVRVVFDFKGDIKPYDVVKGTDRIVVFFGKTPAVAEAKVESPAAKIEKKSVEAPKEMIAEEVKASEAPTPPVEEKTVEKAAPIEVAKVAEMPAEEKEKKAEGPKAVVVTDEKRVTAVTTEEIAEEKPAADEDLTKVYKGQKVTLEFKDADIKNIFRIIAEVSGYNMIIDNAVGGKVTIRLVNVPWDQALDLILDTNNLGMTKVGNVIRVLPKAVIKKEEEDRLASKKAREKQEDLVSKSVSYSYADTASVLAAVKNVMTDRGAVTADERTHILFLKDTQSGVDEAVKRVQEIDKPTAQVVIEARIVEANTNFTRDLGIQWGTGYTADADHGNSTGYYFPNSYGISAGGGGSFALNTPSAGGVGTGSESGAGGVVGISFGSINNTLSLDLRLSALETQGWGKIVSSPKITTIDNKEASIQQGFSIPFETTSAGGTQTTFVDANLNLTVTPTVNPDGTLKMKIKASKNSPSTAFKGASGAPAIDKKEATTEILVKDGDTTVIGGIYQVTKGESESFTPFLGKLPIIGWLFKSKSTSDTKTELLIFITPRIVRDRPA